MNTPLLNEFTVLLAAWNWHVALLQETPPRWLRPLAAACQAGAAGALTSRNLLAAARAAAAQWNPDLIASNEGGSNAVLVRAPARIVETERVVLTRRPERRRLLLVRVLLPDGSGLAVANTHLSVRSTGRGHAEALKAAEHAVRFAGDEPLLFGGDLNLRPAREPHAFDDLRERHGLAAPTAPGSIDHLLGRGLDVIAPPRALPPEDREVMGPVGLRLRLSDHAPVMGTFGVR